MKLPAPEDQKNSLQICGWQCKGKKKRKHSFQQHFAQVTLPNWKPIQIGTHLDQSSIHFSPWGTSIISCPPGPQPFSPCNQTTAPQTLPSVSASIAIPSGLHCSPSYGVWWLLYSYSVCVMCWQALVFFTHTVNNTKLDTLCIVLPLARDLCATCDMH